MRILNKEEKIKILTETMRVIDKGLITGFCRAVDVAMFRSDFLSDREKNEITSLLHDSLSPIPEILKYKPKKSLASLYGDSVFWFGRSEKGKQKRIEILKELIDKLNK